LEAYQSGLLSHPFQEGGGAGREPSWKAALGGAGPSVINFSAFFEREAENRPRRHME
jgi:hypothetical protein